MVSTLELYSLYVETYAGFVHQRFYEYHKGALFFPSSVMIHTLPASSVVGGVTQGALKLPAVVLGHGPLYIELS